MAVKTKPHIKSHCYYSDGENLIYVVEAEHDNTNIVIEDCLTGDITVCRTTSLGGWKLVEPEGRDET